MGKIMSKSLRRKKIHSIGKIFTKQALCSGYSWYDNAIFFQNRTFNLGRKRYEKIPQPKNIFEINGNKKQYQIGHISLDMIVCPIGKLYTGHEKILDTPRKHEIIKHPFLLSAYPITQELYEKIMRDTPSDFKNRPQNPVESVSWYDAIHFCNALSDFFGLKKYYEKITPYEIKTRYQTTETHEKMVCNENADGFRLATKIEWEYAAKAGTENQWSGTNNEAELDEYAWFSDDISQYSTQPVGTKKPNEWGFYDMSGNVYEWCWDHYEEKDDKGYVYISAENRGGSWYSDPRYLSIGYSDHNHSLATSSIIGFRVAKNM